MHVHARQGGPVGQGPAPTNQAPQQQQQQQCSTLTRAPTAEHGLGAHTYRPCVDFRMRVTDGTTPRGKEGRGQAHKNMNDNAIWADLLMGNSCKKVAHSRRYIQQGLQPTVGQSTRTVTGPARDRRAGHPRSRGHMKVGWVISYGVWCLWTSP